MEKWYFSLFFLTAQSLYFLQNQWSFWDKVKPSRDDNRQGILEIMNPPLHSILGISYHKVLEHFHFNFKRIAWYIGGAEIPSLSAWKHSKRIVQQTGSQCLSKAWNHRDWSKLIQTEVEQSWKRKSTKLSFVPITTVLLSESRSALNCWDD